MRPGRGEFASAGLLLIGIVGIGIRLWLWWSSTGSPDVPAWSLFGQEIHDKGLAYAYENVNRFNHPPLMGLYAAQAWELTRDADLADFSRLIKVPGLVGDLAVLAILTRIGGLPMFAAYATAPAAVLITSYHGNTDGFYVAFVLLAALAFDRRHFFWAGLAFAAAVNVKALPLILLPLLLIALPDRRALLRAGGGLALGVLPYLPLLGSARDMYSQILAYNSFRNDWGLNAFLSPASSSSELPDFLKNVADAFVASGRYILFAVIVCLALACRYRLRLTMVEQFAIGGALFLVLAPGFGVQYILLALPFVFLVSLFYGLALAWLAGVFIAFRYWIPLRSDERYFSPQNRHNRQLAGELGVLAWAFLVVFVWQRLAAAVRAAAATVPSGRSEHAG